MLKVSDYWMDGSGWRWHKIGCDVPMSMMMLLASEVVRVSDEAEDILIWGIGKEGISQ